MHMTKKGSSQTHLAVQQAEAVTDCGVNILFVFFCFFFLQTPTVNYPSMPWAGDWELGLNLV